MKCPLIHHNLGRHYLHYFSINFQVSTGHPIHTKKTNKVRFDTAIVCSLLSIYILVRISVIKYIGQKQLGEEKVYFILQFSWLTSLLREVVTETQAGKDLEGRDWIRSHNRVLLTDLFSMTYSNCSLLQDTGSKTHSELSPQKSIINQEDAL